MANPIFSTYQTKENQVTSTILAVFERLNSATVTKILQVLMEDSVDELIKYENQAGSTQSRPDGRIKGLFDYVLETKIVSNAIDIKQIENHYNGLEYGFSKLLVLTPDQEEPPILEKFKEDLDLEEERIIWVNFDEIIEAINSVIEDSLLLLDREKFLLLELKEFIISQDLISEDYSRKALIVPAGRAWGFYGKHFIYKCQANRTFQPVSYMGFYADKEIKPIFPKVIGFIESFNIQKDNIDDADIKIPGNGSREEEKQRKIVKERLIEFKHSLQDSEWDESSKYIVLSTIDSSDTFRIAHPIKNDKRAYTGKITPFVQRQTYLNIDELANKRTTSELTNSAS